MMFFFSEKMLIATNWHCITSFFGFSSVCLQSGTGEPASAYSRCVFVYDGDRRWFWIDLVRYGLSGTQFLRDHGHVCCMHAREPGSLFPGRPVLEAVSGPQ
jgi:hypothetical protein